MAEAKPRKWFQVHLSTAIVMMFVAAIAVGGATYAYRYLAAWQQFKTRVIDSDAGEEISLGPYFVSMGEPGFWAMRKGLRDERSKIRSKTADMAMWAGEQAMPLVVDLTHVYLNDPDGRVRTDAGEAIAHILPVSLIGCGYYLAEAHKLKQPDDNEIRRLVQRVVDDPDFNTDYCRERQP